MTKMYRKNNDFNLSYLVNNLEFIDVKGLALKGRFPKISYEIEKSILGKILNCQYPVQSLVRVTGSAIYYRSTGGRYFKVITNYSTNSTKEKVIYFDQVIANIMGAILSSNLFFWYYQIYSNNLDLKRYELESFRVPVDKIGNTEVNQLESIYSKYLLDIEKNANERITERYANIDSFKEYKIGKSKHIIDEIDDVIGPLYGLTKDEIDYIKNYEISYRISG